MADGTSAPGGNPPDKDSIIFDGNGNLSVGLSNIIDSSTITLDGSGNISVNPPIAVWGEFNEQRTGDWTVNVPNGANYGPGYESEYSIEIAANGSPPIDISRNIDLTNINEINFYYKENGSSGGDFALTAYIDGSQVFNDASVVGAWTQAVIDVSGLTGTKNLKIECDGDSFLVANIDKIEGYVLPSIKGFRKIVGDVGGG